jgi:hypothetical protein
MHERAGLLTKVPLIDLVERRKISHIGQKARCLDNIFNRAPGRFQNNRNVFAGLFRCSSNTDAGKIHPF